VQISLKERIVGLVTIAAICVIFVPMIFDSTDVSLQQATKSIRIIPKPPVKHQTIQVMTLRAHDKKPLEIIKEAPPKIAEQKPQEVPPLAKTPAEATKSLPLLKPALKVRKVEKALSAPNAWAVQLGSFSNVTNAKVLEQKLQGKGFHAYVLKAQNKKGRITKVLVGPEVNKEKAKDLIETLYKEVKLRGIIVKYKSADEFNAV